MVFSDLKVDKSKNTELVEKIKVEGTPFYIIRNEDKYFVVFGQYKISEDFETKEAAELDATREDWERLMTIIEITVTVITQK